MLETRWGEARASRRWIIMLPMCFSLDGSAVRELSQIWQMCEKGNPGGGSFLQLDLKRPPGAGAPGRFDRQIQVDPPDVKGRVAILNVHAKDKTLAPDVDLDSIARQTPGMSGAELADERKRKIR